jgi:hypothetical protein
VVKFRVYSRSSRFVDPKFRGISGRTSGSRAPTSIRPLTRCSAATYYGKLSGYGTRNPTLTDVFYVMTKTDPETKQVTNMLVKRGKELHGPDRMWINANQIVTVEPVGPDSKVAQLISQANQ